MGYGVYEEFGPACMECRKWIVGIDYNNGEDTGGRAMPACQTQIIRTTILLPQVKVGPCKNEKNISMREGIYRPCLAYLDMSTLLFLILAYV